MKKILISFVALVLVLSSVLFIPGEVSYARAPSNTELQSVNIAYSNNGVPSQAITSTTTKIDLTYNFRFTNLPAGETIDFLLPPNTFKKPDAQGPTPFDGNAAAGTYQILADGTVRLNLNPISSGTVNVGVVVSTWIDPNYKFSQKTQSVELLNNQTVTLTAGFNYANTKRGVQDGGAIKWTIDVNKGFSTLQNVTLVDLLEPGLTLKRATGDIKVYELQVETDGEVTRSTDVTNQMTLGNSTDTKLEIGFPNTLKAYRVEFTTTVASSILSRNFGNTATFNGSSFSNSAQFERKISVTKGLQQGMAGSGTVAPANTDPTAKVNNILWQVDINAGANDTIPANAVLEDTINFGQSQIPRRVSIDQSSLQVQQLNASGTVIGILPANTYQITHTTVSDAQSKFELKFLTNISDHIRITYRSQDSAVASIPSIYQNLVANTAQLHNGASSGRVNYSDSKTAQYWYKSLGNREFSKKIVGIDYQKKTIEYKITANVIDNLKQVKVEDIIGRAQTIDGVTPVITKDGVPYTDFTVEMSNNNTRAHYKLYTGTNKTQVGKYEITIVVPFDSRVEDYSSSERNMNNSIYYSEDGADRGYDFSYLYYEKNRYMINNGYKDHIYDATNRKINWTVGFNYNIRTLAGAQITDTWDAGLKLERNSLQLLHWPLEAVAYNNGTGEHGQNFINAPVELLNHEAAVWNTALVETANGFTLNMDALLAAISIPNKEKQAYILKYDTTIKDNLINQATYNNQFAIQYGAQVTAPEKTQSNKIQGIATVPRAGEYASKTGKQIAANSRTAIWKVDINAAQSDVSNVKVTDTLSAGQMLLPDTIKLYEATVSSAAGNPLLKGNEVNANEYTLDIAGNTLTVTMNGTVKNAYILEYHSYITAANGTQISNNVSVTGNQIQSNSSGLTDSESFAFAKANASASVLGDVTVEKLDVDTNDPIKDVEFSLTFKDEDNNSHVLFAMSNALGIAEFKNIPKTGNGEVEIREIVEATGYVKDTTVHTATIGQAAPVKIYNKKIAPPSADVLLIKTDAETGEELAGVKFDLKKYNTVTSSYENVTGYQGVTTAQVGTDPAHKGRIELTGLEEGSYRFIETEPLAAYKPAPDKDFTIAATDLGKVVTVSIQNSKKPTTADVALIKTDALTGEKLVGVEFKLQEKVAGATDYTDVTGYTNLVTNGQGRIELTGVPFGDYQFVETQPLAAYEPLAQPAQFTLSAVDVADGKEITVTNTKKPTTADVALIKTDALTGEKLANVEFKLQEKVAGVTDYTDVTGYTNLVTNGQGRIELTGVPFGDYQFVETKPLAAYEPLAQPAQFTLSAVDVADGKEITVTNTKKPTTADVALIKTDALTGEKLAGVEFKLQEKVAGATDYTDVTGYTNLVTNGQGRVELTGVPFGDYQFVETQPLAAYEPLAQPEQFTLSAADVVNGKEITVTNTKKPTTADVALIKTDALTGEKLVDVEFKLQQDVLGNNQYSDVVAHQNLITNNEGRIELKGLPFGSYRFIETKPLEGYEPLVQPKTFTLSVADVTNGKEITITNTKKPTTADVTLIKTDAATDEKLANVEFKLQEKVAGATDYTDVTGYTNLVTDSQGRIELTGVPFGDYQFIETKPLEGYEPLGQPKIFTLNAADVASGKELLVTNDKKFIPPAPTTADIVLIKTDAVTSVVLAGVEFKLQQDLLGNEQYTDVVTYQNSVTNNEGRIELKGLPFGSYQFVETKPLEGYEPLVQPKKFILSMADVANSKQITVTNTKKITTADVTLVKMDAVTGLELADVEFKLQEKITGAANYTDVIGYTNLTTDVQGRIEIQSLPFGDYQFVETKPLAGYEPLVQPKQFTLSEADVVNGKEILVTNTKEILPPVPTTADVVLIKIDAETGTALADVGFKLQQDLLENDNYTDVVSYQNLVTNSEGRIEIKGLPFGSYQFVETKPLANYEPLVQPKTFTLGMADVASGKEISILNYKKSTPLPTTAAVILMKTDAETGAVLADVEFKLQQKETGAASYTDVVGYENLVTDVQGRIEIQSLPFGDYQFVETKPLANYEPLGQPKTFTLSVADVASGKEVSVLNYKKSTPPPLPSPTATILLIKTDANTGEELANVVFNLQRDLLGNGVFTNVAGYTGLMTGQIGADPNHKGRIEIKDLAIGSYQVEETQALPGYDFVAPKQFTVTTADASTVKIVSIQNKKTPVNPPTPTTPSTANVVLTKTDVETGAVLQGVMFDLQQEINGVFANVSGQTGLVTDGNGQIKVDALAIGAYRFVETAPKEGYDPGGPFAFELTAADANETVYVKATNKKSPTVTTPPTATVTLTKTDRTNGTLLIGVEFKLQQQVNGSYEDVASFTTNPNGQIKVNDLTPGLYQFVETKPLAGYYNADRPFAFEVVTSSDTIIVQAENLRRPTGGGTSGGGGGGGSWSPTPIPEPEPLPTTGTIELKKVDATTKAPLTGAEFTLANDLVSYKVGPTNNVGVATVANIPAGSYRLTEIVAPTGYVVDATSRTVTITAGEITMVTLENKKAPATGTLTIRKFDENDPAKLLAGAKFEVSNGKKTFNVTTNLNGEIVLPDLEEGQYVVIETVAPTGYQLVSVPLTVTVKANENALLTVGNVLLEVPVIPENPSTPQIPDEVERPGDDTELDVEEGKEEDESNSDFDGDNSNSNSNSHLNLNNTTGNLGSTGNRPGRYTNNLGGRNSGGYTPNANYLPQTDGQLSVIWPVAGVLLLLLVAVSYARSRRQSSR